MSNKTGFAIAAIAIVAALLVTTSAMTTSNAFATYKRTQTLAQENDCGNGKLPYNVDCQNAASQIQGKRNAASVAASQGFTYSGQHGGKGGYDDGGGKGGYDNGGKGGKP